MNRLLACCAAMALLSACVPDEPQTPPPDTQKPAPVLSLETSTFEARPKLLLADGQEKSTLTVTARTAEGTPIPGLPVTLLISGQNNLLEPSIVDTNAEGQAVFTYRSTLAEPKRLTATINGQQLPKPLEIEFFPGPAARAVFRVPPSTVRAGEIISPAVVLDLQDSTGNKVSNVAKEVTLALGANPGGATLGGTVTATSSKGTVTFDGLSIDRSGTGYTLVASAQGMEPSTSRAFNVTSGPPERLVFRVEPSTTPAGATLAPAVEVAIVDALGNPVEDVTASVALAIATGPSGATLSGQTTVAAAKGVARFTDLSLDRIGDYTFAATAQGYAGATSATFSIRSGAAHALRFTSQPASLTVRTPFSVAVAVEDAGGNLVSDATHVVSLSLSGTGPLKGTTSMAAVAGVATFTGLELDNDGTGFQLEATAPGVNLALTQPFTVTDNLPPAGVTDLRVTGEFGTSLTLAWTETGDDGMLGQASTWEVRYSTSPLNTGNFPLASVASLGTPKPPQQAETFTVNGLTPNTQYYVGLKVADGAGNAVHAFTSGRTTLCPRGYAGPQCDVCATGFRQTSPGVCEDYCTDNDPCNPSPSPSCGGASGNSVVSYPATRACTPTTTAPFFECTAPTVTDCGATSRICHQAQCVADPCQNLTCPGQAPTCAADGVTLLTGGGQCERVDVGGVLQPQCVQGPPTQTNCALSGKVCHAGACETFAQPGAGDLVISEILYSTTTPLRQWFEVQNVSGKLLELAGLRIELVGGEFFSLPSGSPVRVAPEQAFVFGYSADQGANGGVEVDHAWGAARPAFRLDGAAKHLRLLTGAGVVIDAVDFGVVAPSTPLDMAANLSVLATTAEANDFSWYWCTNGASPGEPNGPCGTLPNGTINSCVLQHPHDVGSVDASTPITVYGRFFEPGATDRNPNGNDYFPHVVAEFGFGPKQGAMVDPSNWTWVPASFNTGYVDTDSTTDNDEVQATFTAPAPGEYAFGYRFALRNRLTGALSPYVYCDRNGLAPTPSSNYGTVTFFSGSTGIGDARAAADGVTFLPISGAVVTYLKPANGSDPAGFFVQGSPTGPALFIALNPANFVPPVAKGDRWDFWITEMSTHDGNREATSVVSYSRVAQGVAVSALSQQVSNATDLVSNLNAYEGELLRLSGTFSSPFSGAGTGFVSAQLDTAGISGETNLRVRMPVTLRDQLDLHEGCQVTLNDVPMWRYYTQAQPSIWYPSDITVTSCPPPRVLSATPTSQTQVVVNFDREIASSTVLANGSQFTISPVLQVTSASVSGSNKVTLTTAAQVSQVQYTVTVANSVKDLQGRGPVSPTNTAVFRGVANICTPSRMVISQVYGGGGNSGATYSHDFVELHNRSFQTVVLDGWSLQYSSTNGTSWQVWPFQAGTSIPPGGYYLVQFASNGSLPPPLPAFDATSTLNMSGTSGKVALVDSVTPLAGSCPASGIVDLVGWGTPNCYEGFYSAGSPAPTLSNSTAALRASDGCFDSSNNGADFTAVTPSPRSSNTAPKTCGCD